MKIHGEGSPLGRCLVLGLLALPATSCLTAGLLDQSFRADELYEVAGAFRSPEGDLTVWIEAALGGEWETREYTLRIEPDEAHGNGASVLTLQRGAVREGWSEQGVADSYSVPVRKLARHNFDSPDARSSLRPIAGFADTVYYSDVPDSIAGGFPFVHAWDRGPEERGQASFVFPEDPRSFNVWPLFLVPPALIVDVVVELGKLVTFWNETTGGDDDDETGGHIWMDGRSVPTSQADPEQGAVEADGADRSSPKIRK